MAVGMVFLLNSRCFWLELGAFWLGKEALRLQAALFVETRMRGLQLHWRSTAGDGGDDGELVGV